ncbi:hypothetical protein T492DRAFT_1008165 [Pavlovales sp. CCMP2436]|nr:hypothetical protein T492DRAFT_1008165 [Pavlovales sp. CCMP2436]
MLPLITTSAPHCRQSISSASDGTTPSRCPSESSDENRGLEHRCIGNRLRLNRNAVETPAFAEQQSPGESRCCRSGRRCAASHLALAPQLPRLNTGAAGATAGAMSIVRSIGVSFEPVVGASRGAPYIIHAAHALLTRRAPIRRVRTLEDGRF